MEYQLIYIISHVYVSTDLELHMLLLCSVAVDGFCKFVLDHQYYIGMKV